MLKPDRYIMAGGPTRLHAWFPHHIQNEIPNLFSTFSWLYDPYSLPILHEIVWNHFTYREYFKILDTRGYNFLTILFCLCSNIIFIILMNWFFQQLWKQEILYLFLSFWPISQPFLTLLTNSLPFQGLEIWFLTFSRFSLRVGTLYMVCKYQTPQLPIRTQWCLAFTVQWPGWNWYILVK